MIRVSLKSNLILVTRLDDRRNHMLVSPGGIETDHHGLSRGVIRNLQKGFIRVLSSGVPSEVLSGVSSRVFAGVLLRVSSGVLPGLSNSD